MEKGLYTSECLYTRGSLTMYQPWQLAFLMLRFSYGLGLLCRTEFPRLAGKCCMSGSLIYEFITFIAGPEILGFVAN